MPPLSIGLRILLGIISAGAGLLALILGNALVPIITYRIAPRGRRPHPRPARIWFVFYTSALLFIVLGTIAVLAPTSSLPLVSPTATIAPTATYTATATHAPSATQSPTAAVLTAPAADGEGLVTISDLGALPLWLILVICLSASATLVGVTIALARRVTARTRSSADHPLRQDIGSALGLGPGYDDSVLRQLMIEAFDEEELQALVSYDGKLKDLAREFARADSITVMVDKTIAWCDRRELMAHLVDKVREKRSEKYKKFEARLVRTAPLEPPPLPTTSEEPGRTARFFGDKIGGAELVALIAGTTFFFAVIAALVIALLPNPLPETKPSATAAGPILGELRFCLESQFDRSAGMCQASQDTFTGSIDRVYVSWTYANVYRGMNFDREWRLDDALIRDVDGTWNEQYQVDGSWEYTWLDASGLALPGNPQYFPSGTYEVRFFVGENRELAQSGTFDISR